MAPKQGARRHGIEVSDQFARDDHHDAPRADVRDGKPGAERAVVVLGDERAHPAAYCSLNQRDTNVSGEHQGFDHANAGAEDNRARNANGGEDGEAQSVSAAAETHVQNGRDQENPEARRKDGGDDRGNAVARDSLGSQHLGHGDNREAAEHAEGCVGEAEQPDGREFRGFGHGPLDWIGRANSDDFSRCGWYASEWVCTSRFRGGRLCVIRGSPAEERRQVRRRADG